MCYYYENVLMIIVFVGFVDIEGIVGVVFGGVALCYWL